MTRARGAPEPEAPEPEAPEPEAPEPEAPEPEAPADKTARVQLLGASHGAKRNAVVTVDSKKARSLIRRGLARAVE